MPLQDVQLAQVDQPGVLQNRNPLQIVQAQAVPKVLQPAPKPVVNFGALRQEFTRQNNILGRLINEEKAEYEKSSEAYEQSQQADQKATLSFLAGVLSTLLVFFAAHQSKWKLFSLGLFGAIACIGLSVYQTTVRNEANSKVAKANQDRRIKKAQLKGLMGEVAQTRLQHRLNTQDPRLKHRWPVNTQVFTTHIQDTVEWYDNRWINRLDKLLGNHNTLREACEELQRTGHSTNENEEKGYREQPLVSTNQVSGWDQRQKRPRRGLIILGKTNSISEELESLRAQDLLKETFSKRFGLKEGDIRVLVKPSKAEVEQELAALGQFSDKNKGAEAFVILEGHGNVRDNNDGIPADEAYCKQGGMQGGFWLQENTNLLEDELKGMFNRHLGNFSSTFLMMSCCYSGAWSG